MGVILTIFGCTLIAAVYLIIPKTAYAIVILPPIIIVSVVQIVVGVITAITAPTSIVSGIIVFLKKPRNLREFLIRTISATIGVIVMIGIFAAIIAKIIHPERPWW